MNKIKMAMMQTLAKGDCVNGSYQQAYGHCTIEEINQTRIDLYVSGLATGRQDNEFADNKVRILDRLTTKGNQALRNS